MAFNWLRKLAKKEKRVSPKEVTAHALSQAMRGKCPRCQNDLHNHAFQMFAITVASSEKREALSDFIRKATDHDWESVSKFSDSDPMRNALEVYALRCEDGRLNLLFVRDPFELFDGLSIEDWETLNEEESTNWQSYLSNEKWLHFAVKS